VAITPDLYPDFLISTRITFAVFTALGIAGILASLVRAPRQDQSPGK
jgi:hypothetical protein